MVTKHRKTNISTVLAIIYIGLVLLFAIALLYSDHIKLHEVKGIKLYPDGHLEEIK